MRHYRSFSLQGELAERVSRWTRTAGIGQREAVHLAFFTLTELDWHALAGKLQTASQWAMDPTPHALAGAPVAGVSAMGKGTASRRTLGQLIGEMIDRCKPYGQAAIFDFALSLFTGRADDAIATLSENLGHQFDDMPEPVFMELFKAWAQVALKAGPSGSAAEPVAAENAVDVA